MAIYAIGDIHGGYRGLLQCLERCNFNKEIDTLISLGDVCDGYPEVDKCIDLIISLPNTIKIAGNHDIWTYDDLWNNHRDPVHLLQGGDNTLKCYINEQGERDETKILHHVQNFFNKQVSYHTHGDNVFTHGGFDPREPVKEQSAERLAWHRQLTSYALYLKKNNRKTNVCQEYSQVFIGHTPTTNFDTYHPIITNGLINLDTGAGYGHKLTIMNIETLEYWQSDTLNTLYPGFNPRG